MSSAAPIDPRRLFDPGFVDDPYPIYHALRSTEPVCWDVALDSWVLTRHAAVARALNDSRLVRGNTPDEEAAFMASLVERGE